MLQMERKEKRRRETGWPVSLRLFQLTVRRLTTIVAIVVVIPIVAIAFVIPVMVVVHSTITVFPIAIVEPVSIVMWSNPPGTSKWWACPIAIVPDPLFPVRARIPISFHPNVLRPRLSRPGMEYPGCGRRTNSNAEAHLSKQGCRFRGAHQKGCR